MTEKTTTAADSTIEQVAGPQTETVTLDTPIERGGKKVTEISVRKPLSGALRGVTLTDVLQLDVSALIKILPRITDPALTEAELRNMDPADLVQLGGEVAGFLLPKQAKEI